jgi:hypothetical protein
VSPQLSPENSETQGAGLRASLLKGERKMKKTVLTIAGSALMVLSAVQFAAAAEQHGKIHHRATTEFRDSNAYAEPLYSAAAESEASRYSGGYSAPAGR